MSKRLLFCVETTKQADTDYSYILDTIRHYYDLPRNVVLRPVYMESKTRYNSRAVREDIRRQSGPSDAGVIYCIDTDDYNVSPAAKALLDQIRDYCRANGFDFIFFCRDVEDVFHGRRIPDTEKVQAVRRFRSSRAIEAMKAESLEQDDYRIHCSNILNVLDRHLSRRGK